MENYQEQYKQELHQQEIRSNLQTLKGFFWIFATILMIWVLTLLRIFIVDAGIFTMAVGMSVVIGIPIVYIYKKVDLSKQWVKYVFLTLICMISAIFVAFLSFHAALIYVLPLLLEGRTIQRIQETLFISAGTVSTHIRHIYQKTGSDNRQELIDLSQRIVLDFDETADGPHHKK